MIADPQLLALRSDDAPQRLAQAELARAARDWRSSPSVAAVLADLDRFASDAPLERCPALAALFAADGACKRDLVDSFVSAMTGALASAPLGHVPMRHFTNGVQSTLMLARTGNTSLSLVAYDGSGMAQLPDAVTVDFGPSEIWEQVLAGSALGELIERTAAELVRTTLALCPGVVLARDCSRTSLQLRQVDGCLVMLRMQRRRAMAGVTCEYRLADGALVHQAAGNPRDSRIELMLALLGRMARTDAAPHMTRIAGGDGSAAMRWQALRECLALDTGEGFAALTRIMAVPGDALAKPAAALHRQLLEMHPQLKALEPCPA